MAIYAHCINRSRIHPKPAPKMCLFIDSAAFPQ